ncbi:MAG: alpha/beta fold hydrolase [Chloroflexota bacterium]
MRTFRTGAALLFTAAGGGLLYSHFGIDHNMPIENAIDADRKILSTDQSGMLSYYVDTSGSGTPIVLIHSVNAAAGSHEMRPLFEAYRGKRPVYALDLPGFGYSERTDRDYSVALYDNAISDFLDEVVEEPADLIALSLGCEFAARTTYTGPERVNSLTLISPTGFGERPIEIGGDGFYNFVKVPLWSQPLFDLLTIKPSIQYYLGLNFVGTPPDDFIDYAYRAAHQPGARFAPLAFLSGRLFSRDIRTEVYEQLPVPTLVVFDKDPNINFGMLDSAAETNPNIKTLRIAPSLGLPHWELPTETNAAISEFAGVE